MSLTSILDRSRATMHPALIAALVELLLTSIHHGYGAIIYTAPFRWQVVIISAIVAALIIGLALVAQAHRGGPLGRVAFWVDTIVIAAFPILTIGFVEGGYNHVVKNVVHLMGNATLYAQMFPDGMYEAPGDWFFELTGIAQFPVAVAALWLVVKAMRRG